MPILQKGRGCWLIIQNIYKEQECSISANRLFEIYGDDDSYSLDESYEDEDSEYLEYGIFDRTDSDILLYGDYDLYYDFDDL
jgi:hypothetical protein